MAAAHMLVGMIATSIAQLDDAVTVAQLRVLVLTSTHGPLTLGAVATELGVHPSNATRTVDRLVTAGLLHRRHALSDRRQLELTLTDKGRVLVDSVMSHRRSWVRKTLSAMPADRRDALVHLLSAFVESAGSRTDEP